MCRARQGRQRTPGVPRKFPDGAAVQKLPQRAVAAGPDDQQIGVGAVASGVIAVVLPLVVSHLSGNSGQPAQPGGLAGLAGKIFGNQA